MYLSMRGGKSGLGSKGDSQKMAAGGVTFLDLVASTIGAACATPAAGSPRGEKASQAIKIQYVAKTIDLLVSGNRVMNGPARKLLLAKEKTMTTDAIDTESNSKAQPEATKPKGGRKPVKKTKTAKKAAPAKKAARKPKTDRTNKKAEVLAMMQRAKGATLGEIMAATKWQAHTVRGFVSILGSKGGQKIESSKNAAGERTYKIDK
jgi:hypothetical protein